MKDLKLVQIISYIFITASIVIAIIDIKYFFYVLAAYLVALLIWIMVELYKLGS